MNHNDDYWMKVALREAEKARLADETPVGAVLVRDGRIIGRGRNKRETRQDVTLHAEMIAIRQASRRLSSWRLDDCVLYVTLEPCVMCAGAIIQSRLRRVVFGAHDPKAGAAGSVTDVFALKFNHQVEVTGGVLAAECSEILKAFFRERRAIDKVAGTKSERKRKASER